jgi:hypothetical protein
VPLESRYRRAARQIGHHSHSGGSSPGGSVVAVSQTSDDFAAPPIVDLTFPATSRPRLRAPAFISHRWKSPMGSLPGCVLILKTLPLLADHIRRARRAEMTGMRSRRAIRASRASACGAAHGNRHKLQSASRKMLPASKDNLVAVG